MVRRSFNTGWRAARGPAKLTSFSRACYGLPSMGRSLALLVLALLVTGCATRASYHRLTADVATLRGEVTDLRQAQGTTSRDVARTAAEARALEARLSEMSAAQTNAVGEVTTLRGRLDTAEGELREARARTAAVAPPPASQPPAPTSTPPVERPRLPASPPPANAQQAYDAAL